MAKRYRITCKTDPYHASRYARYKGREILEWNGATPVKWVHDDYSGLGYTLKEVRQALMSFAYEDAERTGEKIRHKYFSMYYESDVFTYAAEEFWPKHTKQYLKQWLENNANSLNSVYVLTNGGGPALITPDLIDMLISNIDSPDYDDRVEYLAKGLEPEDFKDVMPDAEYDGTQSFAHLKHNAGYNQENADMYIQYWED